MLIAEKVVGGEARRQPEAGRDGGRALLGLVGVEVDHGDHGISRRLLGVGDQGVVGRVQEGDVREVLERRVVAPDEVDLSDQRKQLEALQKDVDGKIEKILTSEQKKQLRDMRDNKVLWENPSVMFRQEYDATAGHSSTDAVAFFQQDTGALERMSSEFARTIVSAILEAF